MRNHPYNNEDRIEIGTDKIFFACVYCLNFSLKDFICDSSSSEEEQEENPSEFYPKVNRLIDNDSSWRK
jgi:hypothetical protein